MAELGNPAGEPPQHISPFIGREDELAKLASLFANQRIVNLPGPPGRGKSCLALEFAHRYRGRFPDGVTWVDLGNSTGYSGIAEAIAAALQLSQVRDQLVLQTVTGALREQQMLLVVDDCTESADDCEAVFSYLLEHCKHLKILATSVCHLGSNDWCNWVVPPLALNMEEPTGDDDAVRLFATSAEGAGTPLLLDQETVCQVRDICAQVGCEPQYIKWAAGRLAVYTPEEIAEQLRMWAEGHGGESPSGTLADEQHIGHWLKHLLGLAPQERDLLARLAIFPGSFTRASAEAVCTDDGMRADVHWLIPPLHRRSLIDVEPGDGVRRYRIHPVLRKHCLRGILTEVDLEELRAQRLRWLELLAERAGTGLRGPDQAKILAEVQREYGTLQAALRELTPVDADRGLQVIVALWRFWEVRG
ncbi:MAG: AAA family ATPase, partial [Deltaproteobacteria bacterium]|nr:AAA family ATPase [Deltaproteobacteria bacterium]